LSSSTSDVTDGDKLISLRRSGIHEYTGTM